MRPGQDQKQPGWVHDTLGPARHGASPLRVFVRSPGAGPLVLASCGDSSARGGVTCRVSYTWCATLQTPVMRVVLVGGSACGIVLFTHCDLTLVIYLVIDHGHVLLIVIQR